MMPPERKARLLAQQVGDVLKEWGSPMIGRCVADCLPSSRIDSGMDGRTLVLRYGPSKKMECRTVNKARNLIVDALTEVDGGEFIAVKAEMTE